MKHNISNKTKQFVFFLSLLIACSASSLDNSLVSLRANEEGCDFNTVFHTLACGCRFRFLVSGIPLNIAEACQIGISVDFQETSAVFQAGCEAIADEQGRYSINRVTDSIFFIRNHCFNGSVPSLALNSNPIIVNEMIQSALSQLSKEEQLFILVLRLSVEYGGPEIIEEPSIEPEPSDFPYVGYR